MSELYSGIEEYHNAFDKAYCEEIIKHFEVMARRDVVKPNNRGHGFVTDNRIVFDWAHTQKQYHYDYGLCDHFYQTVNEIYMTQYVEKYSMLKHATQHSPKGMSLQRTGPHEGYHAWHAEALDLSSASRIMTYMLYLNDVDEGGETEFLYQGVKLKPEQGKLVLFPTNYLYPHRGNPIYKGYKYIITGWFTFDE